MCAFANDVEGWGGGYIIIGVDFESGRPEIVGIPNSDPTGIDFVIPCNDDASTSISLIIDNVTEAIKEGLSERKAEKEKEVGEKKPAVKKVEKVAEGTAEATEEKATEE